MPRCRLSSTRQLGFWVVIVILAVVGAIGYLYPTSLNWLNLVVLTLTLAVLVWYAHDTRRIADQMVETNLASLRPVVLRSSFLTWDQVRLLLQDQGGLSERKPLQFTILKNIAHDIRGHIVFKNRKYGLLFGSRISEIPLSAEAKLLSHDVVALQFEPRWAWMRPDELLFAIPDTRTYQESREEDHIYTSYRDIGGNRYFTREDKEFCQVSGKL